MANIASGGAEETPRWQRVYWCALEGAAAAVLLLAGGLGALQAATLVAALPFAVVMILLLVGLVRQMNADLAGVPVETQSAPLAERLKRILSPPRRAEIEQQTETEGAPALDSVRDALASDQSLQAETSLAPSNARLSVRFAGGATFEYKLAAVARPLPAYSPLEATEARRSQEWRLIARVTGVPRGGDVAGFTRNQLVADVLDQLGQWRRR